MESALTEQQTGVKRKRNGENEDTSRLLPPLNHPSSMAQAQINYMIRARPDRLRLIDGDPEGFAEVLAMIDDYEGILQRQESLAVNLGAKLAGPLLLKSLEKLFDAPIKLVQPSFDLDQSPITWLDILVYARSNPPDLNLNEYIPGVKTARFWIRGAQVEISEQDFDLIKTGGPERMICAPPNAVDESAEIETLNILEARLAQLIKKADTVASKARQLNYHLKGRKTSIISRKSTSPDEARNFSPQPFSAINNRDVNSESARLQQALLDQFLAPERRHPLASHRPKAKATLASERGSYRALSAGKQGSPDRRVSAATTTSEGKTEDEYRLLMSGKIEKLNRGDAIYPPCDRCRRLKFECTKHLTACSACTKKHAKCCWKDTTDGVLNILNQSPEMVVGTDQNPLVNQENGYGPEGTSELHVEGNLQGQHSGRIHSSMSSKDDPDTSEEGGDGLLREPAQSSSDAARLAQIASASLPSYRY